MQRTYALLTGTVLVVALAGCANTLNSVGETAEGAVRGAGTIIEGVGEGVVNIGEGIKADMSEDDDDSSDN